MNNIENMSYVDFISLLKETNRCPGGKDTIHWILTNTFANANTKVLEVGSNTGFTSLEVARTVKCQVLGIDPVASAVEIANEELRRDAGFVQELVSFEQGSAYNIPCEDDSIDLIIAGGSTSFMDDKETAIAEMERVLKPWGLLSVTNLYYRTKPPKEVTQRVSDVIGVDIQPMSSDDWVNIYLEASQFELYKYETAQLEPRSKQDIEEYIDYFMQKPHILALTTSERDEIRAHWSHILDVFNKNHEYLGYIKVLLRKRTVEEEPELFRKVKSR